MSAPHQKLPASNISCRYWATSGTCFFGDQCNFAHNIADRATSGRAGGYTFTRPFPKREKACKELLLNGYCKNENDGCEYNHSIPGVTRSGPPTPTTGGGPSSLSSPSWTVPSSRVGAGGSTTTTSTAAVTIRNKGLPVTAPAFIPAAVAAAQRASLSAWGGLTPGVGRGLSTINSPAAYVPTAYVTSTSLAVTSVPSQNGSSGGTSAILGSNSSTSMSHGSVGRGPEPEGGGTPDSLSAPMFVSSMLPASLNAAPFVPGNLHAMNSINGNTPIITATSSSSSIGGANAPPYIPSGVASALGAPPYVPKAKQHLHGAGLGVGRSLSEQQPIGIGVPSQQLQMRHMSQIQQFQQQQAAHMMAVAARGIGGNTMTSPYMTMDVPMVMQPFRLPDGDDPALGMTAMSPPNPAFAIPMARVSNGNLPVLPAPEALASMGIVGDGSGGLQVGSGLPSHYGSNIQSPSSRAQQINHHMQKLQIHLPPPLQLPGQTHPFTLRPTQKLDTSKQIGVQSGDKQQPASLSSEMGIVNDNRKLTSSSSSSNLFAGDSQTSDHLPSIQTDLDPQPSAVIESPSAQQQQKQQQQQIPQQHLSPSHQQQHLQSVQQRQQQLQQQQLLHQQHMQLLQQRPQSSNQRSIASPVQPQQQRIPFRSLSPIPNVGTGATTVHGGATYFLGSSQGVNSLPHVSQGGPFSGSAGRVESRIRGQSNVGIVPLGPRFMSDQLREELRRRHALIHAQLDTDQNLVNLPERVQRFHTLYPLEDVNQEDDPSGSAFGVRSMMFKGISSSDGLAYAIRRIDYRQVPPNAELATSAAEVVERWASLARHPHIVAVRESFSSREMEDSMALFFVHDYYPGAVTLEAMHLHQEQAGVAPIMVSEEQLWSYMVQLAAVLRAVHSAGLFFRPGGLHPSKVILPTRGRLRVSSAGILDVLNGDSADDPHIFQKEDLAGFGRLILSLACGSMVNPSLEFMAAHYSTDLTHVTQALLASTLDKSDGGGVSSIRQLYHVLTQRMFGEIEQSHLQNDELMSELSKETENGRLLRILIKLGMTNERPEDDMEPGWSETNDRYLLKLFRDFVFHRTTDDGAPLIDWTHVLDTLNKLDAGVPEKMILLSRDERSMQFASYGDLKRCLETAYQELASRGAGDKGRSTMVGAQSALTHNTRLKQRQGT